MLRKRILGMIVALVAIMLVLTVSSCGSIERGARQGVRDGVSQGIAGLFPGGGSSGSNSGGNSSGNSSGGSSQQGSNFSGSAQTVPWPSDTTWRRYGLEGLKQPPGTDVTTAALFMVYYTVNLINGGRPALDYLVDQIDKIPGSSLVTEVTESDGMMVGFTLSEGNLVHIIADFVEGGVSIQAYPVN